MRQFIINTDWRTTDEEITKFIADHNIQNASIKKMNSRKYYIFSKDTIYVYEGKHTYQPTKNIRKEGIVFGGLQEGSTGLIINNQNVLLNAVTYSVTINNESRKFDYLGEKFMIISDERIWNPNPQMTISFFDSAGNSIYKEDF